MRSILLTMWKLFIEGGPAMWGLLVCSLVGMYVVVQKVMYLRTQVLAPNAIATLKQHLKNRGRESVSATLKNRPQFSARALGVAIEHADGSTDEIEAYVSEVTAESVPEMEKNLYILIAIITAAPLLGLLGTVLGLIEVFDVISGGGIGDATQLSGGIAEALITTMTGLMITIPFVFSYHYIQSRIRQLQHLTESYVSHMVQFCKKASLSQ